MHRAGGPAGGALLTLLAAASTVASACPYPLGEFAARGDLVVWDWDGKVEDLESAIVEATLVHGQKSFGQVVNAGGRLSLVYDAEVEYLLPDGTGEGETHNILYKEYSNATGWDVPILYLASDDVTEEIPEGRNLQTFATAFGEEVWTVWDASGRIRENGSYILLRGKTPEGFTATRVVSPDWKDAASKQAKIITVGARMYIAFQTNAYSNSTDEYRLVGRAFDGTSLGPLENISGANDGWSDQVVSLATDGSRVFASWVARNTTDFAGSGDWDVKVAVREPDGTWGPEIALTDGEKALSEAPSAEWYLDRVFVAWATDDLRVDGGSDTDIVMQSYTPPAGGGPGVLGSLLRVSTDEFQGTDEAPSLFAWRTAEGGDGNLHIQWSSDSTPNSIPTSGGDSDIYYRTYDGATFSAIQLVSDPLDNWFVEILPGFFTLGDSLYSYFLSNICMPGCGHETDWRQMTKLLARPAHFYDDVEARYAVYSDYPTALATEARIRFSHADGSPAGGEGYFATLASGEVVALTLTNATARVTLTYNTSHVLQLEASYCGKALPTVEEAPPLPPPPPRPSPFGDVVLPALLAAALLGALGARRLRRG
ncbi:MAG TPA: hypothetical protein VJ547_06385 [Candidatus Thermoplasmatota archaeon]|nr:hypothetical protein [Candidatus Thermoplasmatota archaeon]